MFTGPNIVEEGLVLALDAANTKSYPGSGTTWNDLSGNGRNGTLTNGPTYSSANSGILQLDGTNDTIRFTKDDSLINTSTMSVEMWVAVGNIGSSFAILITNRDSSDYRVAMMLGVDNREVIREHNPNADPMAAFVLVGNGTTASVAYKTGLFGTTNGDSNFHHIVGTFSTGELKLYYDGELQHTNSSAVSSLHISTQTDGYYRIGGEYSAGSYTSNLTGEVASSKIYHKTLTASEVLQNYNATKSRFGL